MRLLLCKTKKLIRKSFQEKTLVLLSRTFVVFGWHEKHLHTIIRQKKKKSYLRGDGGGTFGHWIVVVGCRDRVARGNGGLWALIGVDEVLTCGLRRQRLGLRKKKKEFIRYFVRNKI